MSKILVSGGLVPTTKDTLLDARTRVATFSDIANIENPARFMVITVEETGKKYEVRKLSSKIIGGIVVENSTIDINDPEALVDLGLAEELRSEDEKVRQSNESKRIEAENLRKSSEDSRKVNETNRVSAEVVRETSERTRVTSEDTRNANEQTRNSNETKRQSQESTRQSQESARQNNESVRNTNESARKEAESERKTEETSRRTAELSRSTAENTRVKNEQNRTTAENTRSSAEDRRVTNETQRTTNETARNNAELSREQAEGNRASTFNTLKGQMQTTIQEGQAAVAATEKATSDAQKVVDNYDAKIAEQDSKLTELGSKVKEINKEIQINPTEFKEEEVTLETDDGEVLIHANKSRVNFKKLTQNEVDVLTANTGVKSENIPTDDAEEKIILLSTRTKQKILEIDNNGVYMTPHYLDGTEIQQIWNGKNLAGYGDSITQYNYKIGDVDGQASGGWMAAVKGFFNFNKTYNRGIEGTTMGYYLTSNGKVYTNGSNVSGDGETEKTLDIRRAMCSWDRITKSFPESIKDTVDIVFVMGGTNDYENYFKPSDVPYKIIDGVENKLPEWSANHTYDAEWMVADENYERGDFDVQTYSGAVCSLILKMQRWMPKAKLVLMTPPIHHVSYYVKNGGGEIVRVTDQQGTNIHGATKYEMAIAVKYLANYMGIPCIDLYGECGINTFNSHLWLTDGVHVSDINYKEAGIERKNGYSQLARVIIGKLSALYPNSWLQFSDNGKDLNNN